MLKCHANFFLSEIPSFKSKQIADLQHASLMSLMSVKLSFFVAYPVACDDAHSQDNANASSPTKVSCACVFLFF